MSIGFVLALHLILPAHENYRLKLLPYFGYFLALLLIGYGIAALASLFSLRIRERLGFKAGFHACGFLALGLYNLVTLKFEILPNIYFPAPERILGVFVEDGFFLLRCLVYSLRLLLSGFFLGALAGVFTGTLIGWSRRLNYWIMPFIRVVGPIPSTPAFLVPLVLYVVIASIGTAGVGGGAFNVSLLVLSLMGLPIELVTILMSIDFIIDMGRTLINVSDSILSGFVSAKMEREINEDVLYDKISLEELEKQDLRPTYGDA